MGGRKRRGIGKSAAVQQQSTHVSQPDGHETPHERSHRVQPGPQPLARADEVERLQAERRKRRVAAANPDQEKLPKTWTDDQPTFRVRQPGEKPDDEAAGDIYEQRAERERRSEAGCHEAREPKPGRTAEAAAAEDDL